MDARVAEAVTRAYWELCRRCGLPDVPVAVRSSAASEDSPDASFAGVHDSFLWIRGAEQVLRYVVRCWASLWTARAVDYRALAGLPDAPGVMSVGVQQMVNARAAGVAVTLNPTDGDRSQIAIEASWGLGQAVVAGEVTPDQYLVDKVTYEITARRESDKHLEYRVRQDRVERAEVPVDRRSAPCLGNDDIVAIARLARSVEQHFGGPQDIEWALGAAKESPGQVAVLQSRPETVWSRKPRATAGSHADTMGSIVATLCNPLHARDRAP